MSERTKGRLAGKQTRANHVTCSLVTESGPLVYVAKTFRNPASEANAAHLVACWNAFEEGGAVELARTALRDLVRATEDHSPKCLCDSCAYRGEAIAALSALDAAKGK